MNRYQKIAVAIGVALVVLVGLFPPFEGEFANGNVKISLHLGHHFFFSPPPLEYVAEALGVTTHQGWLPHCRTRIVLSEVIVMLSVVVLVTLGTTLILGNRRI